METCTIHNSLERINHQKQKIIDKITAHYGSNDPKLIEQKLKKISQTLHSLKDNLKGHIFAYKTKYLDFETYVQKLVTFELDNLQDILVFLDDELQASINLLLWLLERLKSESDINRIRHVLLEQINLYSHSAFWHIDRCLASLRHF